MIILNIINNIDNIKVGEYLTIIFKSNHDMETSDNNPFALFSKVNNTKKVTIKVIDFLGKGSFGIVYKIEYKNKLFALKFNSNEIPVKLYERYKSLRSCKKIKKYFIDIYCCGNVNSDKFKYFSIMEYGGKSLKIKNCVYDKPILHYIVYQLVDIVYNVIKYKVLLPDFKLNNLTLNDNYDIKIIDFYIYCDNYSTLKNCTIIKTYASIEMQTYRTLFDLTCTPLPNYNYTYICLPFAFCMIDLFCKYKSSFYIEKLAKKFSIKDDSSAKEIINMIQVSSFYYNITPNENNTHFITEYDKIYTYIKYIENKYPIVNSNTFYEYFLNIIHIKDEYSNFLSREQFLLFINDFINLDPNKRPLNMMFVILKNIKPQIKYKGKK